MLLNLTYDIVKDNGLVPPSTIHDWSQCWNTNDAKLGRNDFKSYKQQVGHTAVIYAKFQNDYKTNRNNLEDPDFTKLKGLSDFGLFSNPIDIKSMLPPIEYICYGCEKTDSLLYICTLIGNIISASVKPERGTYQYHSILRDQITFSVLYLCIKWISTSRSMDIIITLIPCKHHDTPNHRNIDYLSTGMFGITLRNHKKIYITNPLAPKIRTHSKSATVFIHHGYHSELIFVVVSIILDCFRTGDCGGFLSDIKSRVQRNHSGKCCWGYRGIAKYV